MDVADVSASAASPGLTTGDSRFELEALKKENSELKTKSTLLQTEQKAALEESQKENARLRGMIDELKARLDSVSVPSDAEKSIPFLHSAILRLQTELSSTRTQLVEYQRRCEELNGPFGELSTLQRTVKTMEKMSADAGEKAETARRKLQNVEKELNDVKGESEARRLQLQQKEDEIATLRAQLTEAERTVTRKDYLCSELVQHSFASGPFDADNTVLMLPSWMLHGVPRPEGEVHYELYSANPRFHHYFVSAESIGIVRRTHPDAFNGTLPVVGHLVSVTQEPPAVDGNAYGLAAGTIFFTCLVAVH